jgi:hypothetical protein
MPGSAYVRGLSIGSIKKPWIYDERILENQVTIEANQAAIQVLA